MTPSNPNYLPRTLPTNSINIWLCVQHVSLNLAAPSLITLLRPQASRLESVYLTLWQGNRTKTTSCDQVQVLLWAPVQASPYPLHWPCCICNLPLKERGLVYLDFIEQFIKQWLLHGPSVRLLIFEPPCCSLDSFQNLTINHLWFLLFPWNTLTNLPHFLPSACLLNLRVLSCVPFFSPVYLIILSHRSQL